MREESMQKYNENFQIDSNEFPEIEGILEFQIEIAISLLGRAIVECVSL